MAPKHSTLETTFLYQACAAGLPPFEQEFRFHNDRLWRFDFAWPQFLIALELEGGVYNHGRHTRPKGFEGDVEKYNEAARLGWSVYRATSTMVNDGRAIATITQALQEAQQ